MGFEISEAIQDAVMDAVKDELDGGVLRIYKGTVPNDAADAITDEPGDLLVTISESGGGTGLNFEASDSGVIVKSSAETWLGTVGGDGHATYYRFSPLSDTGAADITIPRVQGTVGTINADLLLADVDLITSDEQRIDYFSLGIPRE